MSTAESVSLLLLVWIGVDLAVIALVWPKWGEEAEASDFKPDARDGPGSAGPLASLITWDKRWPGHIFIARDWSGCDLPTLQAHSDRMKQALENERTHDATGQDAAANYQPNDER